MLLPHKHHAAMPRRLRWWAWWSTHWTGWHRLTLPLSWAWSGIAGLRRSWLLQRLPATQKPWVLVIGNLSVGGSGKTPVVIALVEALQARGFKVGVISRGYGRATQGLQATPVCTSAHDLGDEPALIHQRTGAPVVVAKRRAQALEAFKNCVDVVISDDGLQHFGLPRHASWVVLGPANNQRCLPAGPLREPWCTLRHMDRVLGRDNNPPPGVVASKYTIIKRSLGAPYPLNAPDQGCSWEAFRKRYPHTSIRALSALAHPEGFFHALEEEAGLSLASCQALLDHQAPCDALFVTTTPQDEVVVVTEKDAVKCHQLSRAVQERIWVAPLNVHLPEQCIDLVCAELAGKPSGL